MPSPLRTITSDADLEEAVERLRRGQETAGRAVILIGGASLAEGQPEAVAGIRAFLAVLAAVCEQGGIAVVDGGTDAGVMRWFADARAAIGGTFPLVGVAPGGAFERSTRDGTPIEPADGHSLILAVPGARFGDETPWLFATADRLGARAASTIVVNGGQLALSEARWRLEEGHDVIAVRGSGRAADELVADEGLRSSGRLRVVPLSASQAMLAAALEEVPGS